MKQKIYDLLLCKIVSNTVNVCIHRPYIFSSAKNNLVIIQSWKFIRHVDVSAGASHLITAAKSQCSAQNFQDIKTKITRGAQITWELANYTTYYVLY